MDHLPFRRARWKPPTPQSRPIASINTPRRATTFSGAISATGMWRRSSPRCGIQLRRADRQCAGRHDRRRAASHAPDDPVHHRGAVLETQRAAAGAKPGRRGEASRRAATDQSRLAHRGSSGDESESEFARLKEIIVAIRNLRTQYNVTTKSISDRLDRRGRAAASDDQRESRADRTAGDLHDQGHAGADERRAELHARRPRRGAICMWRDWSTRKPRSSSEPRRTADLERQIAAMKGRLANEAYMAKAPPHLRATDTRPACRGSGNRKFKETEEM